MVKTGLASRSRSEKRREWTNVYSKSDEFVMRVTATDFEGIFMRRVKTRKDARRPKEGGRRERGRGARGGWL